MYQITRRFTHLRKFVPKIVPPLLKHRNERYHTSGLVRGGLYEGVLIRGAIQVLRKRWAYLRRSLYAGGFIGGERRHYIKKDLIRKIKDVEETA